MKCSDVEKMVQSYIHETLSPKELEAFISHVKKCPSCYEELEIHFIIQQAVRYLNEDRHDNFDMKALLAEDLRKKERQVRRRKALKMTVIYLGIVLLLAILALVVIWFFQDDTVAHLFQNRI